VTETTSPKRRIPRGCISLLILPILAVCGYLFIFYNPFIIMDFCSWSANAQAWLDEDADGVWDEGEPPMEGVTFHGDYASDEEYKPNMPEVSTDFHGDVEVHIPTACPDHWMRYIVYPDVPPGYYLTTDSSVTRSSFQRDREVAFGFAYLPGAPTVTPRPPAPNCIHYSGTIEETDLQVNQLVWLVPAPDGTLWFSEYNGSGKLVQYIPTTDEWKEYTIPEHDAANWIHSFQFTADNTLWLMLGTSSYGQETHSETPTDLMRFDGVEWETVILEGDPFPEDAKWFSIAPDGKFWFHHLEGYSIYDPETEIWATIQQDEGTLYGRVVFSPDGRSIIVAGSDSEHTTEEYLLLLDSPDAEPEQFGKVYNYGLDDLEFAPDGALWVASFDEGLERFDLNTGERQSFSDEYSGGYINDLAFAADGTLWIATGDYKYGPVIFRYLPPLPGEQVATWKRYDQRDGLPGIVTEHTDDNQFRKVVVHGDTVWFQEDLTLVRCTFPD
jgi:streptogramin lyase